MELRHLRYFAAVAETCHFGQAAQHLHVAQPALSYAIRQLESELDVALFERTTRRVALTAAGEFLQGETERILKAVDHATEGVRRIADGRSGLVRVGLTGTAAFSHLPVLARAVQAELPDVALQIEADMLTPAQCDGLRSEAIDVGVLRPPAVGEGIEIRTVEHEPLVLVVSVDHRLAQEPVVAMADLRSEPFVMYGNRDSAVNEAVLGLMEGMDQASGITYAIAAASSYALVPNLVRAAYNSGIPALEAVCVRTTVVAVVLFIVARAKDLSFHIPRSAWRGSKSVEASTISSPAFHWEASSTSIELLPAGAVLASFVQVFVRSPCRFSVPPESMMPRSPMPIISSPFTLSVRVMVALCVKGLASVPISSSPCTMIHSVVSSRSFVSENASLPITVMPPSGGGLTSRMTDLPSGMVTLAPATGTFLSGQVARSDHRVALASAA